ncbi:MAG: 50S ribosomal protein L13 [Patescibacteria group bacterium]
MTKQIERQKHQLDAADRAVGRLASDIAILLRGKNKPDFAPHIDMGDIVEVSNVSKMRFTGKKLEQKKYYRYSGYPGGIKETKLSELKEERPEEVLERAVRNMLPANKLRKNMLKRLIITG